MESEGRTGGAEAACVDDAASLEADARAERMDRVAELYAHVTALTRDFLAAVATCDRHGDWAAAGFGSCAEWLAWRVGLRPNAARERVRVARALEDLPRTSDAMSRGELSFSKVRAITRAATPANEAELVELARSSSTANLERMVRALSTADRVDEARRERLLHGTRRFSVVPDDEGMYVVRGRLMPEVAALLMRAVDAASDALYASASDEERMETDAAQRRADAVGLLAERALAAGLARATDGDGADGIDGDTTVHNDADVEGAAAAAADAPISGTRAERYQVVLYVEPETLAEDGEPGMSELEDGTRVSAETSRRLACDASVVRITRRRGAEGGAASAEDAAHSRLSAGVVTRPLILDVGRRTRTIPTPLRRALEARDRGCRFPGCGLRYTDGHHIEHWADGGETKLSNLCLLCSRHHRRVHEDGWRVCSGATGEQIVFFTPAGRPLAAAPPLPALSLRDLLAESSLAPDVADPPATGSTTTDPPATGSTHTDLPATGSTHTDPPADGASLADALIARNAARGIRPDWRTNLPRCRHDSEIPWEVEAAAREAIDSGDKGDAARG